MPLPLILVGAALATGILGVKKGVDAVSDNKEAGTLRDKATRKFDKAKRELERAREEGNSELESLGQLRVELYAQQMGRFASLFRELGSDALEAALEKFGVVGGDPRQLDAGLAEQRLIEIRAQSATAGGVLKAGVTTLGSGALAGIGSFGAATMLASASTGTAISTLGGVAATNATLAWFGGGALAAGGLGIAGGTAVLGGIVAGPVLAVGGMLLAAKARENLANARRTLAEADKAASEMNAARAIADAITALARQFQEVSQQLGDRFTRVLGDLETVIERKRTIERKKRRRSWLWLCGIPSVLAAMTAWALDSWWPLWLAAFSVLVALTVQSRPVKFRRLPESDQRLAHHAWLFAQTLSAILDAPLLTKEGAVSDEARDVLAGAGLIVEDEEVPEGVALLERREEDGR